MRGLFFPNSNLIFDVQQTDPAAPKKKAEGTGGGATSDFSSIYTGWEVVENAAIIISESVDLILKSGRLCDNGKPAPVKNEDWMTFVQGLRDAGMAASTAAKAKNQEAFLDVSDKMTTACGNCHDVYREKTEAQGGLWDDGGVTRIAIIGGGPAGYEAALVAVELGAQVTLVDRDGMGGMCVLADCVPSKTLIATSDAMTHLSHADRVGVHTTDSVGVAVAEVHARVKALALAQSSDIARRLVREGVTVRPPELKLEHTGRLDHIAFTATGLADVRARLKQHKAKYREQVLPRVNVTQLFIEDPDGLGVELNFPAHETGT